MTNDKLDILLALYLTLACSSVCFSEEEQHLRPPPNGHMYVGVYPGGKSGEEDDLTQEDLIAWQSATGHSAAWVYFSNNWYQSRQFPKATAKWIREAGAMPFIRLMLRSNSKENHKEPFYTLDAILKGKFDADLKQWGADAQTFGGVVLAEWGTECNGEWFPWNGVWNGSKRARGYGDLNKYDGPERFAAAFQHIVETIRAGGGRNVQWVFHVNSHDEPDKQWNRFENYYPGDEYVDFLAVSVYGPKSPDDKEILSFEEQMDDVYARLIQLSSGKPVIVAEFGCASNHRKIKAEDWAGAALDELLARRWPQVMGFSWWNERWENGRHKADTTMRVQDNAVLAQVFREKLEAAKDRLDFAPLYNTKIESRIIEEVGATDSLK